MSKDNGRPDGLEVPSRSTVTQVLRAALSPEERALRDWTDLRNQWIASGFTGVDAATGDPLPALPVRPPDPPRAVERGRYVRASGKAKKGKARK